MKHLLLLLILSLGSSCKSGYFFSPNKTKANTDTNTTQTTVTVLNIKEAPKPCAFAYVQQEIMNCRSRSKYHTNAIQPCIRQYASKAFSSTQGYDQEFGAFDNYINANLVSLKECLSDRGAYSIYPNATKIMQQAAIQIQYGNIEEDHVTECYNNIVRAYGQSKGCTVNPYDEDDE